MGRFLLLAALIALAACSENNPAGSPADLDIRKAILRFYAEPGGVLSRWDPNYMKYARIVRTGRCEALDSDFICRVTFDRPGGEGRATRFVWMTKGEEGWAVSVVTSEIPPEPL